MQFLAHSSENPKGIRAMEENLPSTEWQGKTDLPVRKIELFSKSGQKFSKEQQEIKVFAVLYPQNATYQEIEWSVVNNTGIPSNLAKIIPNQQEVVIKALGDGAFRLRCTTKNGTEKTKLISQLEFTVEGLGRKYKDPYSFVSGGLYDSLQGDVTNGNEHGVATSPDKETQVGFTELDFGDFGSNEITIPIFTLNNETYPIQIWEGMPGEEGSSLLADVIYQKESIWNTYQEETYRLSKRLQGITTLCFVVEQKIHIKGFTFHKVEKAFETLQAKECDSIYGDTFLIAEDAIEGIGNNVSLIYNKMNFGERGFHKLILCGKSPIEKNTIHVRFEGEENTDNQLIEFDYSDDYIEREYNLESVTGNQKVIFLFLPGSHFDFKWFRFE